MNRFDRDRQLLDGSTFLEDDGAMQEIEDLARGDGGTSLFESDFEHMMQLRAASQFAPSGQPIPDDPDRFTMHRQLVREEQEREARTVSLTPVSFDRGVLGHVATILPGNPVSVAGPLTRVAFWPGEDRECQVVSVSVQPAAPFPTADVAQIIRPYCQIEWGVMGAKYRAEIDCAYGMNLVLNASSVTVSVGLEATSNTAIDVFGSVGFWSIGRSVPALRTAYIDDLAQTAEQRVDRPPFASTIYGFDRVNTTLQFTIDQMTRNGTTISRRVIAANTYLTAPIPLSNDTAYVIVTNDGGSTTSARLVWGLW
ncbi:hypothetical protein HY492_01120 [Candidatus Woesearchaeota archaeon]|nr:hypothetical protein [Candidatus Woesearchaeota archaeon]